MVFLISQSYRRYYHSNKCSCATAFCVLMYAAAIIIPFFLAFATNNFWLRKNEIREQPVISFRDEAIVYVLENSATAGYSVSKGYSTVSDLNTLFENAVTNPSIRSIAIDSNQDGKYDSFEIQISFSSDATNVQGVQVYLFFNYGLSERVRLQMQDFLRFDISSTFGISKAYINGDIELRQRSALQASTVTRNIYNTSLFDDPSQNINIVALQNNKNTRNETLYCNNQLNIVPGNSDTKTQITIQLNVPPEQAVLYIPTILENLKFSWIQYLTLFIPIYLIIEGVLGFAFKNKIFATQEVTDLSRKLD